MIWEYPYFRKPPYKYDRNHPHFQQGNSELVHLFKSLGDEHFAMMEGHHQQELENKPQPTPKLGYGCNFDGILVHHRDVNADILFCIQTIIPILGLAGSSALNKLTGKSSTAENNTHSTPPTVVLYELYANQYSIN